MLYVSMEYSMGEYEVFDTDDESRTPVNFETLVEATRLGVVIEGVKKVGPGEIEVSVYKNPESVQRMQAKAKILYGIDIEVHHDVISYIFWDDATVTSGARINLSKFGRRIGNCALQVGIRHRAHITLVLDDSIKVGQSSLYRYYNCGVILDITAVTDEKAINFIYDEWLYSESRRPIEEFIIDRPERLEKLQACGVIMKGYDTPVMKSWRNETLDYIQKRFIKEFKALSEMDFYIHNGEESRTALSKTRQKLRVHRDFWMSPKVKDYTTVRRADGLKVFNYMLKILSCDVDAVNRFYYYMVYVDSPRNELIRKRYVNLVTRFYRWVIGR